MVEFEIEDGVVLCSLCSHCTVYSRKIQSVYANRKKLPDAHID